MIGSQQAARAVSIRAEIEWVIGGKRDRRDVLDAADVPFESVDVVRTPSSWKHKRNYEGYYWAATTGSHVWFESLYERAALMRLDRDRRVTGLAAQPMWIHWSGVSESTRPTSLSAIAVAALRSSTSSLLDRSMKTMLRCSVARLSCVSSSGGTTSCPAISPRPSTGTFAFSRDIASTAGSQRRRTLACGSASATVGL